MTTNPDRNMRWATIIEESKDKGPYKLVKVKCDDHEIWAIVGESYGIQASPTKDSQVLILLPDGDEGKAVIAYALPPPKKRTDQQKPGEVSLVNHVTGNRIHHRENGDTVMNTKGIFYINSDA